MDKYLTKIGKRKEPDKDISTASESSTSSEPPEKSPRQEASQLHIKPTVVSSASANSAKQFTTDTSDLGTERPAQPVLKNYPRDHIRRHFKSTWYEMFPWLEYSIKENKAFCFPCRIYGTRTSKSEDTFTTRGYNNWKCALVNERGLKLHNKSEDHELSMMRWEDRKLISEGKKTSINNLVDPERESLVNTNREYFKFLVKYHIYFCKNELAYRGRDESEDSTNPGNWKDFINLQLETNSEFKQLHSKIKAQNAKYDYTSKRSSNELVECLADVIREIIVQQINSAGMFSLLIDESKDNAGHEELATCFRYLDAHIIHERFFSLSRVPKPDAEHLVEDHVMPLLRSSNITAVLVGGGADGASVMSGRHDGVFEKLKVYYPWIIYVHCAAHRLNLVVTCYLSTSNQAKTVLSVYKALHHIFNVSNNLEILEAQQKEIYPNQPVLHITVLHEVRWSCKFEGVNTVLKRIKAILVALQIIANGNSKTADEAAGTYHKMMSSSFITSLVFLHNILAITDGLNKQLQAVSVDWIAARSELQVCKTLLQDLSVDKMEKKVLDICLDISITTEYEDPIHVTRRTLSDYFKLTTAEGKNKVCSQMEGFKSVAVKKLVKELDHRFNGMSSAVLTSLNSLDAGSRSYLQFEVMEILIKHYNTQLNICETLLETECSRAKLSFESGNTMVPEFYPNLQQCIKLSKTLPVNTATVERGFSCMNRVISYARNSLTSERASDLILLSLNKDLLVNINTDEVIKKWAERKNRHVPLY